MHLLDGEVQQWRERQLVVKKKQAEDLQRHHEMDAAEDRVERQKKMCCACIWYPDVDTR